MTATALEALDRALQARRIGHALAFLGQPGLGQEEAARRLVAGLNCPVDPGGCGECRSCRRALAGLHAAYTEFAPTGAVHRVAEVREQWLPAAHLAAGAGAWKVLRVLEADRMNEASANAFLKVLEEPPERTTWVLDVADPDDLPDTVLSRCRVIRFQPWTTAALYGMLRAGEGAVAQDPGESPDAAAQAAVRAAGGSPQRLRARTAVADGGTPAHVVHCRILRRLREEGPGHAIVAARMIDGEVGDRTAALKERARQEIAELDELYGDAPPRGLRRQVEAQATRREREARTLVVQEALDDLALWLRDVLAVGAGAAPADVVFADDPDGLHADADALDAPTALRMLDHVMTARESLEFNVQQQLTLEALFLQLSALMLRR